MLKKTEKSFFLAAILLCMSAMGCTDTGKPEIKTADAADQTLETVITVSEGPTEIIEETEPDAVVETESEKPYEEGDEWYYLDRNSLNDDTYDSNTDGTGIAGSFIHYEIGRAHEGVKYYLEYIDADSLYITFDNSANDHGRCIELNIFDKTLPNVPGKEWTIDKANYYIAAGETLTKKYRIDGQMLEESPVAFGISIFDNGFKYYNDRADVTKRDNRYNLDITYYGIDNTVEYYDIDQNYVTDTLPDGFCNMEN